MAQGASRVAAVYSYLLAASHPRSRDQIIRDLACYDHAAVGSPEHARAARYFERDKQALREAGIALRMEQISPSVGEVTIGYSIDPNAADEDLPQQLTEDEEIVALAAGAHWGESGRDPQVFGAFIKLATLVGLRDRISVRIASQSDADNAVIVALIRAISAEQNVTFAYKKHGRSVTQRLVSPQQLFKFEARWHLLAWDHKRKALRNFLVDRIVGEIALSDQVDYLAVSAAENKLHLQELNALAAQNLALIHVRYSGAEQGILQRRAAARYSVAVSEGQQTVEALLIPFADLHELARDVAGYGEYAQVIAPPTLAAEVAELWSQYLGLQCDPVTDNTLYVQGPAGKPIVTRPGKLTTFQQLSLAIGALSTAYDFGGATLDELADLYAVTPETIRTSIDSVLALDGERALPTDSVPLIDRELLDSSGEVLVLEAGSLLTQLAFTAAELDILQHAICAIKPDLPAMLVIAAETLLLKLVSGSAPTPAVAISMHEAITPLSEHQTAMLASVTAVLATVTEALRGDIPLVFDYTDKTGHVSRRMVAPQELVVRRSGIQLQGFCHTRAAVRHFALDRMANIYLLDQQPYDLELPEQQDGRAPHQTHADFLVYSNALPRIKDFSPQLYAAPVKDNAGRTRENWTRARVELFHAESVIELCSRAPGEIVVIGPPDVLQLTQEWAQAEAQHAAQMRINSEARFALRTDEL